MSSTAPIVISYEALRRLVMRAYSITKDSLPTFYPTIEMIDELLESREFENEQVREDAYKFFAMYLCCGFIRDKAWHKQHPGKRYVTPDNLILYMLTPMEGAAALKPHVMLWDNTTSDIEKEDRQAVFEYMQSLVMDKSLYVIDRDIKSGCA